MSFSKLSVSEAMLFIVSVPFSAAFAPEFASEVPLLASAVISSLLLASCSAAFLLSADNLSPSASFRF